MVKKVGIIGAGAVAKALAAGFLKYGSTVTMGTSRPEMVENDLLEAGIRARVASPEEAAREGDLVVLAVKGRVAEEVVASLADALAGKVVIDTTNPISEGAPENGVLPFFTDLNQSLMERLQAKAPQARFVKSFNSVGSAFMVNPSFSGGKASMFIAGNDPEARAAVTEILETFGWEVEDMGAAQAARAIEPLCMLWCIPGFLHGRWNHAFALLKG